MKTIQINVPDNVDLNDSEAKMLLATGLYEKGKLTAGQAAQMAGLTKRTFLEILKEYDQNYINHAVSDIASDISNAKKYTR